MNIRCGAGMDRRLEALLRLIPERELTATLPRLPGTGRCLVLSGTPEASDIVSAHGDDPNDRHRPASPGWQKPRAGRCSWSAVAKIIDFNVPPATAVPTLAPA